MKLSLDLAYDTSSEWVESVLSDFDAFLQDHADCERKASAMAMSFVAKCPDRLEIIPELIATAIEELEHFQEVYEVMEKRNVPLKTEMTQDHYIQQLIKGCRSGREERLLDRLLIASVVECRGAERFKLVADHHPDPEMALFYKHFWTSEAKHGHLFVKFALHYWDENTVYTRLQELIDLEAGICRNLTIRPALH